MSRLETSVFLGSDDPEIIDTRFGKITVQKNKPIVFPRGLLGMPDKFSFFLSRFPSAHLHQFKLLQCLDDYALSFITLPLDLHNALISVEDISAASNELKIKLENLAMLLIVSVQRAPGKVSVSVNARAPLFIDSASRTAAQYVFPTDKYQVQHPISV